MKPRGGKVAQPGQYMIIGRKDDSDEVVFSIVSDIPANPRLTMLCRRALYEMGIDVPWSTSSWSCCMCCRRRHSDLLDQNSALRRYVHANYGH